MNRTFPAIFAAFCALALTSSVMAAPPRRAAGKRPPPKVRSIQITPARARLDGPLAVQRLLVTATLADGSRRDVTAQARFASDTPRIAAVSPQGEAFGLRDGQAVITARWQGKAAKATLDVRDARAPVAVSFVNDVIPSLSRLGCNQGTCHGAAQGKGGFRLSLRGYAPELDHLAITRQLGGRRISREAPEQSLFLRKPLLRTAHRGGRILTESMRETRILLDWLKQGARGPTGKEPTLAKLEILPGDRQMTPKETQRLLVRATFSDGRAEDVTHRALFTSNDLATATVTPDGAITMQRPGETAVIAKYLDKLATARVLAPYPQQVNAAAYRERNNFIDDHVNQKLKELRIEPSGLCTDEEFLRRATIDALGTLPTADEARAFLSDQDPQKRGRLVDALLRRPEFGQVWALKFSDLFLLRRENMHRKYAMLFHAWLLEQFNANRPWDKIATDILAASGDLESNRGGLFYVSRVPQKDGQGYWLRGAEPTAEMAAQVFLGARLQCAKCHNHPTEKYTQDDYYHFVALWQQAAGKGESDEGVPEELAATDARETRQPRTGQLMAPRPLDRSALKFAQDEDRRKKAVEWMIRQDEFAQNIVNRLWARCFGTGIIEPVDDIRSTNPPKNAPLMRALAKELREHRFDLKYLLGTIMKSRAYQRSAVATPANRMDTKLFSHYPARRLGAEELADAIAQVTGVPDRYQGVPYGARACELADTEIPSILLDTFGRPPRVVPSDSERTCDPAISQALAILNSQAVQEKLKDGSGVLPALLSSGKPDAELLETLFLSALARRPTQAEARILLELVKKSPSREEGFQDVLWALLNSKEFLFNH